MDGYILQALQDERERQDVKWGANRYLAQETWLTILMEEVGETAKAALEDDPSGYAEELVQVAAVAIAALESHRAGPPSLPRHGEWPECAEQSPPH
ncbi:hypothetical protein LCGC14_0920910 [marine sediment metagenome]|uniref:NTP pyrophosphohydrolase MazG putative catalytic core domain-containing protein n=1 Tax=marine sediment metagenome TaxID=412755 RepID=A0A0F9PBH6_9ZZZZ